MVSTGHNSDIEPSSGVRLVVRNSEGHAFIHELQPGNGAVTGSDRTCSLHLQGDGIGALHCMIRFEFGVIQVKDWYSDSGTFINNRRIDTETELPDGGEIRIGSFQIRVANAAEITELGSQPEDTVDSTLVPSPSEEFTEGISLADEKDETSLENLANNEDDSSDEWADDFGSPIREAPAENECDLETFDLMREEVEFLQSELADRDARLAEMSTFINMDEVSAPVDCEETTDTEALVDRLEQLLEELTQGDERTRTLEDLLQFAEEANLAEQEERQQLDGWITDIEDRIGDWEQEWQAEIELLRQQVGQLTEERDRAENAATANQAQQEFKKVIKELRRETVQLQEQLRTSQAARVELESRLESLDEKNTAKIIQDKVDETLREERLQYAQEQATMARERAEISRLKLEMKREDEEKMTGSISDVDNKFREFREHLKDIHQEEKKQRKGRKFSSRLASLWKRLEGRS